MKRLFCWAALALGMLVPGACGKAPEDVSEDDARKNLLELLKAEDKLYQDQTIFSRAMGKNMTYSVWLPGGYDDTKTYPFLYLLHGYEYGDQSHLDRYWVQKGNARSIAREYMKDGGVPMVIVMPNGLDSFYVGKYETYFEEELMAEVEKAYHCNGKRAIAGLSMGGYGTLYHALKYPAKFTCAYAMSPAVMGEMEKMVDEVADKGSFPAFTIEVGEQDTVVDNIASQNLYKYLKENGIRCEWISRPGVHDWVFWQACLPKALKAAGDSF